MANPCSGSGECRGMWCGILGVPSVFRQTQNFCCQEIDDPPNCHLMLATTLTSESALASGRRTSVNLPAPHHGIASRPSENGVRHAGQDPPRLS